jgi:hypothetical protein
MLVARRRYGDSYDLLRTQYYYLTRHQTFFIMAAPTETEPTGTRIEAFFRPSTRFRDTLREQVDDDDEMGGLPYLPQEFTEMELLPHLTLQEILATGITSKDFCRFLGADQIVWTAPDVYVGSEELCYIYDCANDPVVLYASHDNDDCLRVHVAGGAAATVATATCDFLVTLLATTNRCDVLVQGCSDVATKPLPVSAATLSRIFQENHRNLPRTFTLSCATLNEEQIRALETASSPDVEVMLASCSIPDNAGCREVFVACLQNDGCPIKLQECAIDCQVLATALAGNSRVTSLVLPYGWRRDDTGTGVNLRSLAENKSLVHLGLFGVSISDENWSVLCQSLQAHPTVTSVDLRDTLPWRAQNRAIIMFSREQKAKRTSRVAEMMQTNTVLQTIHFSIYERDDEIYSQVILPRLETNRFRPRVLAVKKTVDRPFREKVLGRALHCVRSNPNLVWMFLSQNVDAFVRSEEEEEEEESNSEETVAADEAEAVAGSKRKR